jgi:heat-inducible transcriptional repressor
MSDLEDLGLITQPHTSSGRIPSDRGYRLYVDSLMHSRPLTDEETTFLQRMIMNNINQAEYLMQETAKAVALLTRYTTVVSRPREQRARIKHVQLMPLDERSILIIAVTDAKAVKNHTLYVQDAPGYDTLNALSLILNKKLHNKTLEAIDRHMVEGLLDDFGRDAYLLMPVLGVLADTLKAEDDFNIYTSGVRNILDYPEFADRNKAQAVFEALEERELLYSLFGDEAIEGIQIIIGAENRLEPLRDCSVIRANYSVGDNGTGCIGIIGPTRMDYTHSVSVLNGILDNIKTVLQALTGR